MRFTNKHLPKLYGDAFIRALKADPYDPGDAWITTTALVGPPLIRRLRKDHADEISQDVLDMLWALVGQAMHSILQRGEDESVLVEERLYGAYPGRHGMRRVSGAIDFYGVDGDGAHVLADWKFTSVWPFVFEEGALKPEWEGQANVNAQLLRDNGFQVDRAEVVAILKDWSQTKAAEGGNYPKLPVIIIPVPLGDPGSEFVKHYISQRIMLHEEYESKALSELAICTPDERWAKPTVYKVQKDGVTIRGGIQETLANAQALAQKLAYKGHHDVLTIPGKDVRCGSATERGYCAVAEFCHHGRKLRGLPAR